jgi:phosphate transport system ATP-binding protein
MTMTSQPTNVRAGPIVAGSTVHPGDAALPVQRTVPASFSTASMVHDSVHRHPPIIKVNDFKLWYGKTQALKGITMPFPKLHVTALIGPSGCGKSTLLRSINRLNDFVDGLKIAGTMELHDRPIYAPGVDLIDLRRRMGMVFQKANPFPMSIYENVAYTAQRIMGHFRQESVLDEACEKLTARCGCIVG